MNKENNTPDLNFLDEIPITEITLNKWREDFERIDNLIPFLEKLTEDKKFGPYEILSSISLSGKVLENVENREEIEAILKQARKMARAAEAREKQHENRADAAPGKAITYKNTGVMNVTTTKLAREFYSIIPPTTEIDGQMYMNLKYTSNGQIIPLTSSFSFNESIEEKDRHFTAYDYFVGTICNNLFLEGNTTVTPSKILKELGDDTGATNNINKLMKALYKGMATIIEIDNKAVLEAWGKPVKSYKRIKTAVIPVQIKDEVSTARGNVTDTVIIINGLSPFYLVGDPINQVTKWDKRIFKLYDGNKNERYWRVLQYLMQEIAWTRNDTTRRPVIVYDTVYQFCGDRSREMKRRTKEVLWKLLLNVFVPLDYIYDVKEDALTGNIVFKWRKTRQPKIDD